MKSRRIDRGLSLTEVGFGAAQLGNFSRAVSDEDARAAVDAAWDAGIRYFDTAPHYGLGLSERRLGAALRSRDRDTYVLSTKVGRLLEPNPAGANSLDDDGFLVPALTKRVWDFSRDGVLRSIEDSLDRLGLDRIDIAYLHDPDDHWQAASTTGISALIELRDQGVIGAIGAGMNQAAMLAEFIRRCDVDVMMVAGRYTLLDQSAADKLLPLAEERDVALVAAAVYNSGLLSTDRPADGGRFDYREADEQTLARARRIADLCDLHGVTLPAAAIAFPLLQPQVASIVVGMRSAAQVSSTLERYRAQIPAALWQELRDQGVLRA
ncbi:aldo/keto reductase [Leifsonia shinshuensis]|uniref:aldo/keto reductase n=1 Tax=Leifsonia shinshuensis TaxID=150026 RepID=UPI00286132D5|nr:aldo/keto reductase [Leifsonia shinshuensis]MDR6972838.1 D-threo-aldose 1-dehydrogenase [Leifsonia shinshuensis]